ncbi:ROK family protein [Sphingomonas sp.]|uniref:ROK family protein n=1 Tax=Sphingomonas sp. TaxID=28214 RepID=UPI0025E9632B|nr:ROK family protein [Sphingomonas sp.]
MRLAGLELGGTNANLALGSPREIVERCRLAVTDGPDTLVRIADQLRQWHEQQPIEALGIASFGPLQLDSGQADYGHIVSTVKPGWDGADVLGALQRALNCPAKIHTDVTGAALAEGAYGAAIGCHDFVYITVGTGIGMGLIVGGKPVVASLHPEAGHLRVRRMEGDRFGGVCTYHEDCLEGLASGPAISARTRQPAHEVADDSPIWPPVIDALAEGCSSIFLTLASERIVLGGGVINQRHWLVEEIAFRTAAKLGGYLPYIGERAPIVAARLGADAGQRGALILAHQALQSRA